MCETGQNIEIILILKALHVTRYIKANIYILQLHACHTRTLCGLLKATLF